MRIGVSGRAELGDIIHRAGHEVIELPMAAAKVSSAATSLSARRALGEAIVRTCAEERLDLIIDERGCSIGFVDEPGQTDRSTLAHEAAGVPLLSLLDVSAAELLPMFPAEIVLQALMSSRWTKIIDDPYHAAELRRMGVPLVEDRSPWVFPSEFGENRTSRVGGVIVFGDAAATVREQREPIDEALARIVAAERHRRPDQSLIDVYFDVLRLDPNCLKSPEPAIDIAAAIRYLRVKAICLRELAILRGDTAGLLIARGGLSARVVGSGWEEIYGIGCDAPEGASLLPVGDVNVVLPTATRESTSSALVARLAASGAPVLFAADSPLTSEGVAAGNSHTWASPEELVPLVAQAAKQRSDTARGAGDSSITDWIADAIERAASTAPKETTVRTGASTRPRRTPPTGRPAAAAPDKQSPTVPDPRVVDPPPRLMILLNPGRMSRHWLIGITRGAERNGIETDIVELGEIWEGTRSGKRIDLAPFERHLKERNVRCVLSYAGNGGAEWSAAKSANEVPAASTPSVFQKLGIPQIHWWSDHPHWAEQRFAASEPHRALYAAPGRFHIVKSEVAARELREVFGWQNAFALPVAEDESAVSPAADITPDYDLVSISGAPPTMPKSIQRFLDEDDPSPAEIRETIARDLRSGIPELGARIARSAARTPEAASALLADWLDVKLRMPFRPCLLALEDIRDRHEDVAAAILAHPPSYLDAVQWLWDLSRWERTFYLRYLAKHFRVGVFGSDWSAAGASGSPDWIDHEQQSHVYARGKIAIAVAQPGEEEGCAHKPFQMAASGVCMMHDHREGIEDLFTPDEEIVTFRTPREARDRMDDLLRNPSKRESLARRAHERFLREHTWTTRVPQMLALANWPNRLDFRMVPLEQNAAGIVMQSGSTPHPITII